MAITPYSSSNAASSSTPSPSLDLSNGQFFRPGIGPFSSFISQDAHLTSLNVSGNHFNDGEGIQFSLGLVTNTTLRTLQLQNNALGDGAATALAEALKVNSTLTSINLASNAIGEVGGAAIAAALLTNTSISSLPLHGNPEILDEDRATIALQVARNWSLQDHPQLSTLKLAGGYDTCDFSRGKFDHLEGEKDPTDWRTQEMWYDQRKGLADTLHGRPHLTAVDLSHNDLSAGICTAVLIGMGARVSFSDREGTYQYVKSLNLSSCRAGIGYPFRGHAYSDRPVLSALELNTGLTSLNLSDNHIKRCDIGQLISRNTTLRSLDLSQNQL